MVLVPLGVWWPGVEHGIMTAEGSRPSCTIREFGMVDRRQISLEDGGEILAEATISAPDEASGARAEITVAPGHLPVGTRQKMADAVHEMVCDDNARHLTASVPKGDAELVDGIRGHLSDVDLRAAGASTIIHGDVEPLGRG